VMGSNVICRASSTGKSRGIGNRASHSEKFESIQRGWDGSGSGANHCTGQKVVNQHQRENVGLCSKFFVAREKL
jgi:hypothetical protein